jgi:hypothetical protein
LRSAVFPPTKVDLIGSAANPLFLFPPIASFSRHAEQPSISWVFPVFSKSQRRRQTYHASIGVSTPENLSCFPSANLAPIAIGSMRWNF